MTKHLLLIICIFLSVSVTAETVYKKTNPDGSVTFTDQQSTDSEEVKIREPITFKPTRLPSLNLPSKKSSSTFKYTLNIKEPENDSTIVGQMDVLVSVAVLPDIRRSAHQIRYKLAGQSIVSQNTSETFKNVDRGTHILTVSIVDSDGEVISPIVSRTIHMKRFFKKPTPPKP